MTITVTKDGEEFTMIRWLTLPQWIRQPMTTYVQVPGTAHGKTFLRGQDNATTTLSGMVLRNATGIAEFDSLSGATLSVSDGITTKSCIVTNVSKGSRDSDMAWVTFVLTLREVGM